MLLVKPRTRGRQLVKHRTRLDRENNETLCAYAHFLNESPEYVLDQLIDTVLARDKEFFRWRAEHQESFVPRTRTNGRRVAGAGRAAPHASHSSGEALAAAVAR